MSDADARSDIEGEFADAVKTAGAYLGALKKVLDPDRISTPEYREREIRAMRDNILKGWGLDVFLPSDPFARHATILGCQYLHCGRDAEILKSLLERDCSHPAYREALEIIVGRIRDTGAATPERLRRWEKERGEVKGRWSPKAARDDLIGSVIEAMATGRNFFFRHQDPDRGRLERDLERVFTEAGNPPNGIPTKDIVADLHKMKGHRWRRWNDGKGLTESEFSEFVKQPRIGVFLGIKPKEEIRSSFPNLLVTRHHKEKTLLVTRHHKEKLEVSICDAVRHALDEVDRRGDYQTVVSIWKRYNTFPVL